MEGNQSQKQDRSRNCAGSGRTQGDEDEDGGVVDYEGAGTGYRRRDWMMGPSEGLTRWARHHLRDLCVMK